MSLPALAGGPLVTLVLEGGVLSCIAKSIWRHRGATAMPAQTREESLDPALGKAPKSPDRVSTIRQDGLLPHGCTAGPRVLAVHGDWLLGERCGRLPSHTERPARAPEDGAVSRIYPRHRLVRVDPGHRGVVGWRHGHPRPEHGTGGGRPEDRGGGPGHAGPGRRRAGHDRPGARARAGGA